MKCQTNISKITQVAKREGFKIKLGKICAFNLLTSEIIMTLDDQVKETEWSLLHELGHAELCRHNDKHHTTTIKRLKSMPKYKPTEAFYRDFLQAEWKAWERGMKIAKREKIDISEKEYWEFANRNYQTYVDTLRSDFSFGKSPRISYIVCHK